MPYSKIAKSTKKIHWAEMMTKPKRFCLLQKNFWYSTADDFVCNLVIWITEFLRIISYYYYYYYYCLTFSQPELQPPSQSIQLLYIKVGNASVWEKSPSLGRHSTVQPHSLDINLITILINKLQRNCNQRQYQWVNTHCLKVSIFVVSQVLATSTHHLTPHTHFFHLTYTPPHPIHPSQFPPVHL